MDLLIIATLTALGLMFLIIEVIVPGISIGAILSLVCYARMVYLSYTLYDTATGTLIVALATVISLALLVVTLRSKVWERISLKSRIDSSSTPQPQNTLQLGAKGVAISRLAPMGKIEVEGRLYEAKSIDRYIDARTQVEVVGFDNFSVIVKGVL